MTKTPKIANVFERCPPFLPIVNYLFHHNQSWRGKNRNKRIKMRDQADKRTGGKRYYGDRIYSTFLTGQAFYRGICRETGYSKNLIQHYLKALVTVGCLKILDDGKGGKGVLYADGYDVPYAGNEYRKISFLKNSKIIRRELINLPQWVHEYQTNESSLKRRA